MSTPKIFVIDLVKSPGSGGFPLYIAETHGDIAYCQNFPDIYTVRETTPEEWRKREEVRFTTRVYQPLPDWFPVNREHFAHPSVEDPLFVAYTPDDAKGQADRQVRTKPGRYLAKFFPDVHAAALSARWAAWFKPDELKIAEGADEIERVYTTGPGSCMSKPADFFKVHGAPYHPTRVYAEGDLKLAYMERDERITARALIWPEKKLVGRIYGDATRFKPLLERAGYSFTNEGQFAFNGARIGRHKIGNGYVLPYLDWHGYVDDDGEFLVIRRSGDYFAQPTRGHTNSWRWCPHYDEWTDPNDWRVVVVSDSCLRDNWSGPRIQAEAFHCTYSGNWFRNDQAVELNNGNRVGSYYFRQEGATCAGNGGRYMRSDGRYWANNRWFSFDFIETLLPAQEEQRLAA